MDQLKTYREANEAFVDELMEHLRSPAFPMSSGALIGLNKAAERVKAAGAELETSIVANVDELNNELTALRVDLEQAGARIDILSKAQG